MSKKPKLFHVGYDLLTHHWAHIEAETEEEAEQKMITQVADENHVLEGNVSVHSVDET